MADTDPPSPPPAPLPAPPPLPRVPLRRAQLASAILAVVMASAVGVGAAFGFDVCAALASVGVHTAACPTSGAGK